MKKIIPVLCCLLLFLLGCAHLTDEIYPNQCETIDEPTASDMYSFSEILDIANSIASDIDAPASRSGVRTANISCIVDCAIGHSRSEESNMYVVNYEDNQGFAIISKYRMENPVMAVINEGTYDFEKCSDNPGFNTFVYLAENMIKNRDSLKIDPKPFEPLEPIDTNKFVITPATQYKTVRDTLSKTIVPSKIQNLKWGQFYPEGIYCPNHLSGCAPTAIAMMIAHFNIMNSTIFYSYPERDRESDEFNWEEIKKHEISDGSWCCSYEIHNKIGRLCRQIGEKAKSDYSDNKATSTYVSNLRPTLCAYLVYMNITDLTQYDYKTAISYLNSGLLLMSGFAYNSDNGNNKLPTDTIEGHTWVADGCYYARVLNKTYRKAHTDLDWVFESSKIEEKTLISINWGWTGKDNSTTLNGYYHGQVFNPKMLEGKHFFDCKYIAVY